MGRRIYREVKVIMYRGISYNSSICVGIMYIRVTVGTCFILVIYQ